VKHGVWDCCIQERVTIWFRVIIEKAFENDIALTSYLLFFLALFMIKASLREVKRHVENLKQICES